MGIGGKDVIGQIGECSRTLAVLGGVVHLHKAPANSNGFPVVFGKRGAGRVKDHNVVRKSRLQVRMSMNALPEVPVTAGDEPLIEQSDGLENRRSDCEAGGGYELFLFVMVARRKAHLLVVPPPQSVFSIWNDNFCFVAEIVRFRPSNGRGNASEPVGRSRHVGIDECEEVAAGVSNAGVAGSVGRLNRTLFGGANERGMSIRAFLYHRRGSVRGVIVDRNEFIGRVALVGE